MSDQQVPQLIFVYGTLRRDPAHEMYHLLARHGRFIGDAKVRGSLYDLGAYPALVVDNSSHLVVGELYEVGPDWPYVVARLDEYEGCSPTDPAPHEYRREFVKAVRPSGQAVTAWAYVLNREPIELPLIESGDYVSWRSSVRKRSAG